MRIFKYTALIALVFFISCSGTKTVTDLSNVVNVFHDPGSKTILVAAHRGAHMGNYENSLASTKQSIRLGVDIVEVDVRTTKDGHLVLMHDSSIDRTTTGKGKVEDLTLAEIRKFRLRAPYGRISEETVPTFEEFLKVTKGKIMVDVDMKTDNVTGIIEAVKRTGTSGEVFYFDDDYDQLDRIKELDPSAQIMPRARSYQMADSALVRFSPPIVHIDPSFDTGELGDMLRKKHARIWINALGEVDCYIRYGNGEEALKELTKHGANMIQTNEPELLLQLLKSEGLHQ